MDKKKSPSVNLYGDLVLDNSQFLDFPLKDLKWVLEQAGYPTKNFAVAGSSVRDTYSTEIVATGDDVGVLSLGATDLTMKKIHLLGGANNFMNRILDNEFKTMYSQIIEKMIKSHKKVILVVVYQPCSISGLYNLLSFMTETVFSRWREFLYGIAYKYKIPVLDLSKTFDSKNRSHYGTSEIVPSDITNRTISDGISYIIENYEGRTVYYQPKCVGSWLKEEILPAKSDENEY